MLNQFVFFGLFAASSLYALARGGAPERLMATVMIIGVALTPLVATPMSRRFYGLETGVFTLDCLILIIFSVIALRANRFWPMGIVVLHGMSVLGHILRIADPHLIRIAYMLMLTFWIYPQLLLLVLGTLRHQRRLRATGADPSWSTFSHR